MRKLSIIALVLACVSVQGCLKSLLSDYQKQRAEREAKEKMVPASKARFHINDVEYYREDLFNLLSVYYKGFSVLVIYNYIYPGPSKAQDIRIVARVRSVREDGTKGNTVNSISFWLPWELFYEGSVIKESGSLNFSNIDGFGYGSNDNRSLAHLSRGDYFEVSIPKFDGFETGDSLRINFSFKLSSIDWQRVDGVEQDCGVKEVFVCNDGVFKEVIERGTVRE